MINGCLILYFSIIDILKRISLSKIIWIAWKFLNFLHLALLFSCNLRVSKRWYSFSMQHSGTSTILKIHLLSIPWLTTTSHFSQVRLSGILQISSSRFFKLYTCALEKKLTLLHSIIPISKRSNNRKKYTNIWRRYVCSSNLCHWKLLFTSKL